jgi:hypothetical protein
MGICVAAFADNVFALSLGILPLLLLLLIGGGSLAVVDALLSTFLV